MTRTAYTDRVRGKYRTRTWLRGHAPWSLAERIPKGEDCGAHEWYRQSTGLDACYHCRVTRPHESMTAADELLDELESAVRAGSTAAESALVERIRDGSAHVVPSDPSAP